MVAVSAIMPPLFIQCQGEQNSSPEPKDFVHLMAEIIFPPLPDGSPDLSQTGFDAYWRAYLADERFQSVEKKRLRYLTSKFTRLNTKKWKVEKLSSAERHQWLEEKIAEDPEMEEWVSLLINVIYEACLLDPHYGVNKQMSGWKWLKHTHGIPRPDDETDYFALLKKWNNSEIIR